MEASTLSTSVNMSPTYPTGFAACSLVKYVRKARDSMLLCRKACCCTEAVV